METKLEMPVVSTYVHVSRNAPISHAVESTSFGVSVVLRIGKGGENDVAAFFKTPEQLERLATEATEAAAHMRQAIALHEQLAARFGKAGG